MKNLLPRILAVAASSILLSLAVAVNTLADGVPLPPPIPFTTSVTDGVPLPPPIPSVVDGVPLPPPIR